MILVDSSVWIDYFRGRATAECNLLHRLLGSERLLTRDPILARVSAPRLTSGAPCTCWGRWSFYRSPAVKSLSARREITELYGMRVSRSAKRSTD